MKEDDKGDEIFLITGSKSLSGVSVFEMTIRFGQP
jgi:hypothetical protein